ncbi:MAG TPA: hypothetical protein VGP69_05480 [Gaiellaceae bacterium]|jgi:hypothetical protein|nr:hypothetical protein [Gaiellaceae bacterium]
MTMLRTTWLVAAAVAAAAVLGFAAPAGAVGQDAFSGVWVGVEIPVGDGSTDLMNISAPQADGTRTYRAWETFATYCGGGPLTSSGTAQSTGNTLTVTITFVQCANGSPGAFPPPIQTTMTATANGQINSGGVIFSRVGPTTAVVVPHGLPVQIAFAGSSDFPDFTQDFRNGIQMAIEQHPMIKGFPITINESDPACFSGDVAGANAAAATAIVSNPENSAVLGNVCSVGLESALPIYENADLVTISGSATDASLPSLGPHVFNRTAVADPNFDAWYGLVTALPSDLAFQQAYQTEFGAPTLAFTDLNFDATSLLLGDLQKVSKIVNGNLVIDQAALASAVRNTTNYQGVTCSITLDPSTGNRVNDPASLGRCAEN